MTSPSSLKGTPPKPQRPSPLMALARLLAREAARKDFAARCAAQNGGTANA